MSLEQNQAHCKIILDCVDQMGDEAKAETCSVIFFIPARMLFSVDSQLSAMRGLAIADHARTLVNLLKKPRRLIQNSEIGGLYPNAGLEMALTACPCA